MICRNFSSKKFALTKSNNNFNNTHIIYFFLMSSIWSIFTCCHQGNTWLFFSIQQAAYGSFWAYFVKYKTLCLQMCVTLFSTSKRKQWSELSHLCVRYYFLRFANKKYEINCRIIVSRTKRKFTTLPQQDALLEAFCNKLHEGKNFFLGLNS